MPVFTARVVRRVAMEIVVVANGCSDATADVARRFGECVRVIEVAEASKANALNVGDQASRAFPRFYVDADVAFDRHAIARTCEALARTNVLAAAPLMRVDTSQRSWAVAAYYRVWATLPYCRAGMIGSGVYALSEAGRARFGPFPGLTADDAFARLHFARTERATVPDCTFTVTPPTTLEGVIHIKTRSHFGNQELRRACPDLWVNEEARHGWALLRLAWRPTWWPALLVYAYVKLAVRRRTRRRFARQQIRQWERDETSRQPATV
jgi:hypothetical protein